MELIEIEENKITLNCEFIANNLIPIINASGFNLFVIMEFIELYRDLQPDQSITILDGHHLFKEIKNTLELV